MPLTGGNFFFGSRSDIHAAVKADQVHSVIDNRGVVNVVDYRDVNIVDGAVVEEVPVVPSPALVPVSKVAETIVDSAIEPDAQPLITVMEKVPASFPTPVGGRPKESDFRRQNPGARDSVVVGTIPSPIPGRPDIASRRANGRYVEACWDQVARNPTSPANCPQRG